MIIHGYPPLFMPRKKQQRTTNEYPVKSSWSLSYFFLIKSRNTQNFSNCNHVS